MWIIGTFLDIFGYLGIFSQFFRPLVFSLHRFPVNSLQAHPASPKMGSSGALLSKQLPGLEDVSTMGHPHGAGLAMFHRNGNLGVFLH